MKINKHSDILYAYLSRLTLADLRKILASAEKCQVAQLNNGTSTQLRYQSEMQLSVRKAIEGMIEHDIELIEKITERAKNHELRDILLEAMAMIECITTTSADPDKVSELNRRAYSILAQQAEPKCRTCSDVGIIGHSEVCPECADTWGDQAELIVYRGVNQFGSDCHFGVESLARVWAGPKGAVERVTLKPVPDISVVAARPAQAEPDHVEDMRAMVEPAPAQDEQQPVAWMRRWAFEGVAPRKVRNENGRMAWPFKFKLLPLSERKLLEDDVALYAAPIAQTAPLVVPDECPHIIVFDDADRENEMFAGCGARPAAMRRWEQISQSWNAHLFVRIEKNSRNAPYPCATAAPQPEQSGLVEALRELLYARTDKSEALAIAALAAHRAGGGEHE